MTQGEGLRGLTLAPELQVVMRHVDGVIVPLDHQVAPLGRCTKHHHILSLSEQHLATSVLFCEKIIMRIYLRVFYDGFLITWE